MNNIHKIILRSLILAFLGVSMNLFAQPGIEPQSIERVGLSGWQFLKIQVDARQAALGGINTAPSHGDVNSIYGNPASLVDVKAKNLGVAFSNIQYIADITYNGGAIAKSFDGIGTFGFSVTSLDIGDIPETINSPIAGLGITEAVVTGRNYSGGNFAAGLSYARRITDRLSFGTNARWIREEIDNLSMSNLSIDIGTMYYTGYRSLRLAMVARNIGPDQNLVGWSEDLQIEPVDIRMPLDFRVGIGMDFLDGENSNQLLTVLLEASHPNDGPERLNLGAEYVLGNVISLRGGYRFNYDEESFTFGGGINYETDSFNSQINYAYVDFGLLKQVHVFSIAFSL